jgi:hypothetical protein
LKAEILFRAFASLRLCVKIGPLHKHKIVHCFLAAGSFEPCGGRREPPAPTIQRGSFGDSLQSIFKKVEKRRALSEIWGQKDEKQTFF